MEFARPLVLLAIPIALLIVAAAARFARGGSAVRFSDHGLLRGVGRGWRARLRPWTTVVRAVAICLLLVAFAGPRLAHDREVIRGEGIDIALVLDISGSMRALDFEPDDRLAVAKRTIRDFVDGRKQDRIGLVVFAAKAFTQCPLTLDYDVLVRFLDEVDVGLIEDGTAIGLGIATGVKRLARSEAQSKVLVLLTDGVNNVTTVDPLTAAEAARALGVRVYTIGVGKEGLAPYPVDHPILGRRYTQIETRIDEDLLRQVSELTEGQYFRAQSGEGLQRIFDTIDELEKSEIETEVFTNYQSLAAWWMIPGLLLLLLETVLAATLFRVLP
ncbi:MAG TPA: VWA domain-containing protein [Candidatus Krumholzibacteria bacterium]|nr:VWA domain-containing protein [Candidatus Krumholzibacteria bacterium]